MRPRYFTRSLAVVVMAFATCHAQQFSNRTAAASYGRLPLTFEANRGQTDSRTQYTSRGPGYIAYLSTDGLTLSLRSRQKENPKASGSSRPEINAGTDVLEIRLEGANAKPAVVGEELQPGIVNYFIGRNPANWRTKIPTYGRVRYKNVYSGIDLVYHGSYQKLEYDFELQPGARPEQIAFEIRGATSAALDANGDLVINVNGRTIQVQSPVVYQMHKGKQVQVRGAYVMKDRTHLGFIVAEYDRSQPLVIDPVIAYATYLGGSGDDEPGGGLPAPNSMALDSSGNVYITGSTSSSEFAGTLDPLPTNSHQSHVFVSKLDPTGSTLIYTDYIGGATGLDYGAGLVLDSSNGLFVTGSTTSSDFPITVNGYQQQQPGPYTGFLTHIAQDGSSLLYSTYLGGSTYDLPKSIAINALGEVYVAGSTQSADYPVFNALPESTTPNKCGHSGNYGFITKFSQDGSSLAYSTYLAGCSLSPYNDVSAISLDANDNLYITGVTNTYDFPATEGAYQPVNNTIGNPQVGYITKLTGAGALSYSSYLYGASGNPVQMSSIAVDNVGSAYVTGAVISDPTFPVTTTNLCDPRNNCYAFVTKLDSTGSTLLYSAFIAQAYAVPQSILLDSNTDAFVLISASDNSFQAPDSLQLYKAGFDALVVEINPDATAQLFSTYLGGSGDDNPTSMALDTEENVYVAGYTTSADFPVTQGAFQTQNSGGSDTFIAKIFTGTAPLVSVGPTTLQFADTAVGSQGPAMNVQLQNLSAMPVSVASVSLSGDFSQTNTCGSSVAAYANCTITVTFLPTAPGNRNGSLALNNNATGAPQVISLQGTGMGATATLSTTSLVFPTTVLGLNSASQTVTVANNGNVNLSLNSISTTGDFSQTNNCGSTLTASGSCTISVTFAPSQVGTRSGSIVIQDNAASSPQSVALSGTGALRSVSSVSFVPSSLNFSSVAVGSHSSAKTITVSNSGTATLSITGILANGDFSQTNNCSVGVAAGASCIISVTFNPGASGNRTGSLVMSDNAQNSPQTVPLAGVGSDFSLTAPQSTASVKNGSAATFTVNLASLGGSFTNAVKLSCSGAPANSTCNLSSRSVTPGAKGAVVTVTVSTTAAAAELRKPHSGEFGRFYAVWMQFPVFGLFGTLLATSKRSKKVSPALLLLAILLIGICFMSACAGGTGIGTPPGTTPGTYAINVTGTSGTLTHKVALSLTVTK